MNARFILFRRGGVYYCEDTTTHKQSSLKTKDKTEALTLLNARNESYRQPRLNVQIARAYLAAGDPAVNARTWQAVTRTVYTNVNYVTLIYNGSNQLATAFGETTGWNREHL